MPCSWWGYTTFFKVLDLKIASIGFARRESTRTGCRRVQLVSTGVSSSGLRPYFFKLHCEGAWRTRTARQRLSKINWRAVRRRRPRSRRSRPYPSSSARDGAARRNLRTARRAVPTLGKRHANRPYPPPRLRVLTRYSAALRLPSLGYTFDFPLSYTLTCAAPFDNRLLTSASNSRPRSGLPRAFRAAKRASNCCSVKTCVTKLSKSL